MKYQKIKNIEFKNRMLTCYYLPIIAGTLFFFATSWLFMPPYFSRANSLTYSIVFIIGAVIFLLEMFAFPPIFIQKSISLLCEKLIMAESTPQNLTPRRKTELLAELLSKPGKTAFQIFLINLTGNIIFYIVLILMLPQGVISRGLLIFSVVGSPLISSIFTWDAATKVCSKAAKTLTAHPLDFEIVSSQKHFGSGLLLGFVYHVILPFSILLGVVFFSCFYRYSTGRIALIPCLCANFITAALTIILTFNFRNQTLGQIHEVNSALEEISEQNPDVTMVPYDLNYDISYSAYLINKMIAETMAETKKAENAVSEVLFYTKEIESAIRSLEFSTNLEGENISASTVGMNKISEYQAHLDNQFSEMSLTTKNTQNNIQSGSSILVENVQKISEITQSNIETISGIKELSEQIEQIWSVISTIDSITEKTKTIAFNAEIETSGMGDSGENFHIVANEIRRLADSITDSTLAIRKKITSIQHASDNLVITSEGGTEKIREESELFTNLEEKFEELKLSGTVTEESAELIRQFMSTQKKAFSNLSFTMQELGTAYFNLKCSIAEVLSAIVVIQEALSGNVGGENE